jgi:hypothetical protein
VLLTVCSSKYAAEPMDATLFPGSRTSTLARGRCAAKKGEGRATIKSRGGGRGGGNGGVRSKTVLARAWCGYPGDSMRIKTGRLASARSQLAQRQAWLGAVGF